MKQWLKRYWLWVIIALFFVIWNGFVSDSSVINTCRVHNRITRLEFRQQQYQASIKADSTFIENLKTPEFLERIARERLYMMRDGEQIYVIEE